MAAQHLGADGMKRAQPRHPFYCVADQLPHAVAHFACGAVGESDAENLAGPGAPCGDQMGEASRQRRGLAGARTRQHQHRPFRGQYRFALRFIQPARIGGQIGVIDRRSRARKGGRGEVIVHDMSEQLGNMMRARKRLSTKA